MNGNSEKMNMENDKKWFVYIGDHHEGPFTVGEVYDKRKAGAVNEESYVWTEGMADWIMLADAKDLSNELKRLTANATPAAPSGKHKSVAPTIEAPRIQKSATLNFREVDLDDVAAPKKGKKNVPDYESEPEESKSKLPLYLIIGVLVIFVGGLGTLAALSRYAGGGLHARIRPLLNDIVERVPSFGPFFHLIPTLPDVTADEQAELETARAGSPTEAVKIAVALSNNDPNRPAFYISTNLPDHTKFDIYLVGNAETLLNKLSYQAQNSVTTRKGFGKSEVFLADGGQLIPKGEYQVVVIDSSEQEDALKSQFSTFTTVKPTGKIPTTVPGNAHFTIMKNYFLGGSRDETYLTRLKQFHEKIKSNADRELQELKQYSDTLSLQFQSLTEEFRKIYAAKKPTPFQKSGWKKNADTWKQISGQLDQTVQTWSKETIQNEFFYGKGYELVKSAYDAIKGLFTLENNFVDNPTDRSTFDIQHGKTLSETRDTLELLHTKLDAISKAPKTPSGLPTREGL